MKALIKGVWHPRVTDLQAYEAARARQPEKLFRGRITADGSSGYAAEPGRYHLYVSYACPFAHRTILYRVLLGLESVISMSALHPRWSGPDGWVFEPDPAFPEVGPDPVKGHKALWQFYRDARPDYTGKVTVPLLWDKNTATLVGDESAEIMRMFDQAFGALTGRDLTFAPEALMAEVEALGGMIRRRVNGGVYRAGFAATQADYDAAVADLFAALDDLEGRLEDSRPYLLGETASEPDWLLFPTLVRFDAVYHGALKCNLRRLADYPRLSALTRRLYAWPGVAETVKLDHVKRHYYDDLGVQNPAIVPAGPQVDFRSAA